MVDEIVKNAVLSIVQQEMDRESADWSKIEKEASKAIDYINENNIEVDNAIYNFLEDADARKKSPRYAKTQIERVLSAME